jgi:hypothetical protein
MTLSILMYGMMACALAALVGALVVEALGSRVNDSLRTHLAAPVARQHRGRVRHDPDCPQHAAVASRAAHGASRSRWRSMPGSCRRRVA